MSSLKVSSSGLGLVLLEGSHEVTLVGLGLEATVAHLGGSIDELQLDVLQSGPPGVHQEGLAQGQYPLLGSDAASLDHDKVLLDHTVVRESTHGVDVLVGGVVLSRGVVLDQHTVLLVVSQLDLVDLLVDLGTVMVALLTSTGDSVLDTRGMPGADTGDLAETLVRLAGKLLGVPPGSDALESFSLGDTDQVDHLVLSEYILDGDGLLEHAVGVVDLIGDRSAVQLDLHDVGLLLTLAQKLLLGVSNQPHHLAVLFDLSQVLLNFLLAGLIFPLHAGLGESFLLGLGPVLVEATLAFLAQVLSPDGLESTEATWGLDIANKADSHHGWGLDDGHSLDNILLVDLRSWPVCLSDDVAHAGLVSEEGSQVDGLRGIVLGEGLNLAPVASRTLLGVESHRPMSGSAKFAMRHVECR